MTKNDNNQKENMDFASDSGIVKYNPSEVEAKWQKVWDQQKTYHIDVQNARKPFYNLMMFPYPSAEGLHVGNMYAFTGSDIYGRFKRMEGRDVLEPIGLDGFGIHSENYALRVGRTPKEHSEISEQNFYRQLHMIGNGFDWERKVETYHPNYYKWTQWLFIQMFQAGLAYRQKAPVNFCPSDKTVLADEQVIDGKCERCGSIVEKRNLTQWFFKITDYAERLLNNIPSLDWTEKVKIAQHNWIGKRDGIEITYPVLSEDGSLEKLSVTVFTTRPDTNFGGTFVAIAPEHALVDQVSSECVEDVKKYVEAAKKKSDVDRIAEGREKTGVFTGLYAINQLTGYKMPIWVSDFVLGGFGTGALVGVPGHDKRDFAFANKFGLEIKRVVIGSDGDTSVITKEEQVQEENGTMVNSGMLDGMDIHLATEKIMDYMEEKEWGKRVTTYHLRDWLVSRQRYWGAPIPMVFCENCAQKGETSENASEDMAGWFPIPEKDLPVLLPDLKDWKPTETGEGPLAKLTDWVEVPCPNCGQKSKRETDVCDTFLDSSWYFLRYTSTDCSDVPFDKDRVKKWLPVHMYIGGAEHSVLHLLYSRFVTMVLKDRGFISFEEPFIKFRAHGLLIKEGAKMSKSKGNVIIPDEYIKKFGADTLRSYLMFLGPYQQGGDFHDSGIEGMHRFLKRVWFLVQTGLENGFTDRVNKQAASMMHKTIKKVTTEVGNLRYNTAIATLMEWYNYLAKQETLEYEETETLLKLLAPFAPHMTEELWQKYQGQKSGFKSIHHEPWPVSQESLIVEESVIIAIQVNGKLRDMLEIPTSDSHQKEYIEKLAREKEKLANYLDGKTVKNVIYVPGKILNFVVV